MPQIVPTPALFVSRDQVAPNHVILTLLCSTAMAVAIAFLTPGGAQADVKTWVGANGANGSDWSKAGNWSANGVPAAADTVIIDNAAAANQPSVDGDFTVSATAVGAGTLTVSGGNLTSPVTVSDTGNLIINATRQIIGDVTFGGTGTGTNSGSIDGALAVSGGTFNNAGVVTGATTVTDGALNLNAGTNLGDAQALTINGGTVTVNADETVGDLSGTGGILAFTAGNGLTTVITGTTEFSGTISGATTLDDAYFVKQGAGSLTLSGTNTTTGGGRVFVQAGTLVLQGGDALGDTNVLEVQAGTVDVQANETVGLLKGLSGGILALNGNTVTLNGVGGPISALTLVQITGSGGITMNAAGAIQQFNTALAYTGATTVSAGTFRIGADDIIADASNVVVNGGTLSLQGFSDTVAGVSLQSGSITGTGTLTSATNYDVRSGTVSAVLGGTVGLDKTTAGTVNLTGANTYTGTTTVNAGVLNVTGAGALASTAVNVLGGTLTTDADALAAGATVSVSGSGTFTGNGADTYGGIIQNGGTINGSGQQTLTSGFIQSGGDMAGLVSTTTGSALNGGTISGTLSGELVIVQTGTTLLTGTISANAYVVSTLQVNGGDLSGNTTLNGGTIAGTGDSTITGAIFSGAMGGTISAAAGTTLEIASVSPNGTSLLTFGATGQTGTVQVNGRLIASSAATVAVAAGTLQIGAAEAGSDLLSFIAGTSVATGATLDIGGIATVVNALTGTGTVTNSGVAAGLTLTGTSTFGGVIQNGTGATSLTVEGSFPRNEAASVTLTGINTFSGGTTVQGAGPFNGSLTLQGAGSQLSDAGLVTVNAGGTLVIDGNETIGALAGTGSGIVNVASGILTTGSNNATTTLQGVVTGAGGLTKVGTGSMTLSGTNTVAAMTVQNGTLVLSGDNAGVGSVTVGGGTGNATLRVEGLANFVGGQQITTLGSVIDYADGVNMFTPIVLGSNDTQLQVTTGAATQTGVISETGGSRPLEKIGAGTLTFAGINTFTGDMTISGGALSLSGGQALHDTVDLIMANGTTVNVLASETIGSVASLSGGTVALGSNSLTLAGPVATSFAGIVTGDGTSSFLSATGNTITMTGDSTMTGEMGSLGGTFIMAAGATTAARSVGSFGGIFTTNGGALVSDAHLSNAGTSTININGSETISTLIQGDTDTTNLASGAILTLNGTPTVFSMTGASSIANDVLGAGTLNVIGSTTTIANTGNVAALLTIGAAGTVINNGTVGTVSNAGNFTNNLTAGVVTNSLNVTNNGTMTMLTNTGTATNTGSVTTFTNTGTATNGGTVTTMTNSGSGNLTNSGTLTALTNSATATSSGTVGTLTNTGGTFGNAGLVNGVATVSGGTVTNTGVFSNTLGVSTGGTFTNSGALASVTGATTNTGGTITNLGGAFASVTNTTGTFTNTSGSAGAVSNAATASNAGTIASLSNTAGTFGNTGIITGALTATAGTVTHSGTAGSAAISGAAVLNVNAGTVNGATTNTGGTIAINTGTFTGGLTNTSGTVTAQGPLSGSVSNAAIFTALADVTAAPGNTFANTGTVNLIAGSYTGLSNFTNNTGGVVNLGAGETLGASTVTGAGGTIIMAGTSTIAGAFTNAMGATLQASGATQINGTFVNNGIVDLANGTTGDAMTISSATSGSGIYQLDFNLSNGATDTVTVTSGGVSVVNLAFTPQGVAGSPLLGPITVFSGANPGAALSQTGFVTGGAVLYNIAQSSSAPNDIQVVTSINPALSGVAASAAMTQSLIGTVVNRPTSPFVSGLAAEESCSHGGYFRASTGVASVKGNASSNGQASESDIRSKFSGVQGGYDVGCFDGRFFNGWDGALGVMAGYNVGSTLQDVFSDPINRTLVTGTSGTDFKQSYLGIYAAGSKDRFSGDLQLRFDQTDFELSETVFSGLPIGLDGLSYATKSTTIGTRVNYRFDLNEEKGINFVPTVGFNYSTVNGNQLALTSADSGMLTIDGYNTTVGFLGGTLARTKINPEGSSATTAFVSGNYYQDFGGDRSASYINDEMAEAAEIKIGSIGGFAEASFGVNYVKILEKGPGGAKQLNANVRADARFGASVSDSYSLTAQIRLSF